MATGEKREHLFAFESGHYNKVTGEWKGDTMCTHMKKDSGGKVHINKDKVEYIETFSDEAFKPHHGDK